MVDIKFSNFRIVVQEDYDTRLLSLDDLESFISLGNFKKEYKDIVYDISVEIHEENYLWLTAKYGNPNPCPSQVLDKENFEYRTNTRTSNLVEMRHQLFMLFDISNNILYLSNQQKKSFIESLLREYLNLGISITSIFVDLDDFDSKIKELKTIKFASTDNLFNSNSTLNSAFKDLLGYGANIDFEITINCKNKPLEKGSILNNLKSRLQNQEVRNLYIVGENDEKFEQVFNAGTFNKKISIKVDENTENLIDEGDVLDTLLRKIRNV